jgi:hypothetical protein
MERMELTDGRMRGWKLNGLKPNRAAEKPKAEREPISAQRRDHHKPTAQRPYALMPYARIAQTQREDQAMRR